MELRPGNERFVTNMAMLVTFGSSGISDRHLVAIGVTKLAQPPQVRCTCADQIERERQWRLCHVLRAWLMTIEMRGIYPILKTRQHFSCGLKPVFEAMLANAMRICEAKFGIMFRFEGDLVRPAAMVRVSPEFAEFVQHGIRPSPVTAVGRVASSKKAVHIIDLQADSGYRDRDPMLVAGVELAGSNLDRRPHAQGGRGDRGHWRLSSGGAAIFRPADRALAKFRCASGRRH